MLPLLSHFLSKPRSAAPFKPFPDFFSRYIMYFMLIIATNSPFIYSETSIVASHSNQELLKSTYLFLRSCFSSALHIFGFTSFTLFPPHGVSSLNLVSTCSATHQPSSPKSVSLIKIYRNIIPHLPNLTILFSDVFLN